MAKRIFEGIIVECIMKSVRNCTLHLRVLGDLIKESEVGGARGVFRRDKKISKYHTLCEEHEEK